MMAVILAEALMNHPPRAPLSNPATEAHITGLNEPESENTEQNKPRRSWWWRLLATFGWLPMRDNTDRALRLALRAEDVDEAMRLLEAGVTPDRYPDTPWLCLVARRQNRALLEVLISHGARVDQADRDTRGAKGRTALHEAAKRGWVKGVRILLAAKADPTLRDDLGHTAVWLAVRGGHSEVALLLLEAGAAHAPSGDFEPLLHEAISAEMVDMLVRAGVPVDRPDPWGMPPIHRQVRMGRAAAVDRLLFHRADPNALDRQGRGAGFWVGRGQADACLKALLDHGLHLNRAEAEGNTLVHVLPVRTRDEALLASVYRRDPDLWGVPNHAGETGLLVLERTGHAALAATLRADLDARRRLG